MNTNASQITTQPTNLPRGPVMIDIAGTSLTDAERQRLRHPLVGGVILFARNYSGSAQLSALTAQIRALRTPPLLIAVDHEGGRVQRFRGDGFTHLPAMRNFGRLWQQDRAAALQAARCTGYVMAAELRVHGIDLSFAPVLDLDYGVSRAIGDRAFHRDATATSELADALATGMGEAGMACVGKHFPGHGFVEADSHHEVPVDLRDFDAIWNEDIVPYRHGFSGRLAGVMPAHVVYPAVAPEPAGFSPFWLQEVLRGRIGFQGVIFSDDLNMQGAMAAGDIVARTSAAHAAGCDMLLVCNRPDLADELLARWQPVQSASSLARIAALGSLPSDPALILNALYQQARDTVAGFGDGVGTDDGFALAAATSGDHLSS